MKIVTVGEIKVEGEKRTSNLQRYLWPVLYLASVLIELASVQSSGTMASASGPWPTAQIREMEGGYVEMLATEKAAWNKICDTKLEKQRRILRGDKLWSWVLIWLFPDREVSWMKKDYELRCWDMDMPDIYRGWQVISWIGFLGT